MGTTAEVQSKRCDCPGCGATLIYAADSQNLRCEYCDTEVDIQHPVEAAGPVERDLDKLLHGGAELGYGTPTQALQCQQCGAAVNFPDKVTSGACCFCASKLVVERAGNTKLIQPESLIPFKVTRDQANETFARWVASLWFRPNDLKRMARVNAIDGVYAPFWTFDAKAETRWTAESGYYYYENEQYTDSDGKRQTRQVRRTRWERSQGKHQGDYDDLLICASKGLNERLVRILEPYNTQQNLVPYSAKYLSGWGAEEYAVEPKEAWGKGQKRFEEHEYEACRREVPGDTHRNLNISMRLSDVTWKHCLLPVYVAAYRYHDKTYRFLVNGESGKVSGEAPYSFWKIFFTVLLAIAILGLIVYFKR